MITAVATKWGWVNRKALHVLKREQEKAAAAKQGHFEIGDLPLDTRFAHYLIQFCESEGLVPEKTDAQTVTIFEQDNGTAH